MSDSSKADRSRLSWRIKWALALGDFGRRAGERSSKLKHHITPLANAFGLGLLDREKIDQLVEYSYASQPEYYNAGNYDYDWEECLIEPIRLTTPKTNLLVAFCGKGRESRIFARHDYEVTGIDREDFMIAGANEMAREEGFSAKFICADFNEYVAESPYDIVYTSTWMYTTYPSREDRQKFLRKCRELCEEEGIIVISYRIRRNGTMDSLLHFVTKMVAWITGSNVKASKGDRIENDLFWHYFTEDEIEVELKEAGMHTCYHQPSENGRLEWRFLRPTTYRP